MMFEPASASSVAVFLAIVAGVVALFLGAVHHAYRLAPERRRSVFVRTVVITALWLGGICALVASGSMLKMPYAGLPFFFGSVLLVSAGVGLSPLGRQLAAGVPVFALVAFQGFRLPLEIILHVWGDQGTIPMSMTWEGQNWDIISGVTALIAAPLARQHRPVAWAVNVIGSVLLLNVIRVAILSSPLPFGWGVHPPLLLALHLPYALIGPVLVGGALIGHIVLTRALLQPAVVER